MDGSDLVLALDVGTTNVKAAVVDPTGHLVKVAHRAMVVEQDADGRAEHDPDELFRAVVDALTEAAEGYQPRISILVPATYQMGLIALGENDVPLTGMMTLLDTRARQTHASLLKVIPGKTLYDQTGCPPLFHYPLAKLFWLKSKRTDLFGKIRRIHSCKDYLLRRLAGIDLAETSVASTTQYMNIYSLEWDKQILDSIGVPLDLLPPPATSETVISTGLDELKNVLGLPNLTGILLGTYDGGAVGVGLGANQSNTAVMNFGTSAMLRYATDNPALSSDGSMRIQSSYLIKDQWIPGGAINNAGAVLNWLSKLFACEFSSLLADAKSVRSNEGLIFLPYLTGERSLDVGSSASGSYFGLRSSHTRGHLVRAALEGVAFSLRRVKDAVASNGFEPQIIRVGSGGSHSALWMEIVASVLNTPLQTTHAAEPGLLGSAMLGYVALGRFTDLAHATREMVRADLTYKPETTDAKQYEESYELFNVLTKQMKLTDDQLLNNQS